ncbi:MAG: DUF4998 domain-containing protein [Odoribacteraceae bacterium]|nr:DUF4998 domain-containing protein [Odoribacteraceae bacterium]
MKTINNISLFACIGIVAIWLSNSCTRVEHVEGAPYAARVEEITAHAGNGKVDIELLVTSDQIDLIRVYYNDRQSSKEITVGGQTGLYTVTIDGLEAMPHEFTIYSYNTFRHESTPTKVTVNVYDDDYLASLWGRAVTVATHDEDTGARLEWTEPVSSEVRTEVIYENQQGVETVRVVPPGENITIIPDIGNWSRGIEYCTYILPEPTSLELHATETKLQMLESYYTKGKMWDACDATTGWGGTLDLVDKKEGAASVSKSLAANSVVLLTKNFGTTFDAGVTMANGIFAFSLYVDDASALGTREGSEIEITSSGGADVQETSWPFNGVPLVNGWNKVELRLSGAWGASADLTRLNFIRIFSVTRDRPVVMKIDCIRFMIAE